MIFLNVYVIFQLIKYSVRFYAIIDTSNKFGRFELLLKNN